MQQFFGPISFGGAGTVTFGSLGVTDPETFTGEVLSQFETLYGKTLSVVHSMQIENDVVKLITSADDLLEYKEN